MSAPKWLVRVVIGLVFGLLMAGFGVVALDDDPGLAILRGAFSGIVFGWFFGGVAARERQDEQEVTGLQRPEDLRAAVRAASRGPVPDEPEVRAAAARLAEHRLRRVADARFAVWFLVVLAALVSAAALVYGPGMLVLTAVLLTCVGYALWRPRHLSRRLVQLRAGPDG